MTDNREPRRVTKQVRFKLDDNYEQMREATRIYNANTNIIETVVTKPINIQRRQQEYEEESVIKQIYYLVSQLVYYVIDFIIVMVLYNYCSEIIKSNILSDFWYLLIILPFSLVVRETIFVFLDMIFTP